MKIVFFEVEKDDERFLRDKLAGHDLVFSSDDLDEKNIDLAIDADVISVFIYSKVTKDLLKSMKNLRGIVTRSTGYDHIDMSACKKLKIKILNVPYYGENTVAEHTFALILDLSRKIHQSYERTVRGNFDLEGLQGFDLKGKTLGIIGLGHIGSHVARIAKGFEMNILVYSPRKDLKLGRKVGAKYCSLNQLLKNSDIITFHCPHTNKTHHILNKNNIKLLKKGAYIINTARGGLIDTTALLKGLAKGVIGGAALDVLEEETLIKEEMELLSTRFSKENLENLLENHLLITFDNVIVTPHNAFNSVEALQRILDVTVDNVLCVLNRRKCLNLVK